MAKTRKRTQEVEEVEARFEKKTKIEDENVVTLHSYLRKQNRPYNLNDIFNNLGGKIGKAVLGKALAHLVKNGDIKEKTYNKQVVYVATQNKETSLNKKETEEKNREISELRKDVLSLQKKIKELQGHFTIAVNILSMKELEQKCETLRNANDELSKKNELLSKNNSTVKMTTVEDQDRADQELDKLRLLWKKRKSMFKEVWDTLSESMEKNTNTLKLQLGIEDDKDAGIDIDKVLDGI